MEAPDPPDDGPDTKAEKSLRFGCGTILGVLIVLAFLPYTVFLDERVYALSGLVIPLACGILALFQRGFLTELLHFIRGLAKWV